MKAAVLAVGLSALIPVVALLWAIQPGYNPPLFYFALRIIVCLCSVSFAALLSGQFKRLGNHIRYLLAFLFVVLAILFNPLIPLPLGYRTWIRLDLLALTIFPIGFIVGVIGMYREHGARR